MSFMVVGIVFFFFIRILFAFEKKKIVNFHSWKMERLSSILR